MALTLSQLLKNTENKYGLTLLAGRNGLENTVRWVHMVEDTEVPGFLHGDELVFTTGIANHQANWLLYFVKSLKTHNASGVVINLGPYIDSITPQVIVFCEQNDFPLFTIPWETRIIDISYKFCRLIINDEKQEQSMTESFKNLIINPEQKEGYKSTLEKAGFLEKSDYNVVIINFKKNGKDITTRFLMEHEIVFVKLFRLNSLPKGMFVWNKNLVLIYQNVADQNIQNLCEKAKNIALQQEIDVYIGISDIRNSYYSISELYGEAQSALKIAETQKKDYIKYSNLGVYKLLLNIKKSDYLASFYSEQLEPLKEYDKEHTSDLCQVLREYLKCNGSVNEMADSQGVHRNTINYKMRKIKEILQIEFNYTTITDLTLAFAISDIIN